jgi:hypothetical protein
MDNLAMSAVAAAATAARAHSKSMRSTATKTTAESTSRHHVSSTAKRRMDSAVKPAMETAGRSVEYSVAHRVEPGRGVRPAIRSMVAVRSMVGIRVTVITTVVTAMVWVAPMVIRIAPMIIAVVSTIIPVIRITVAERHVVWVVRVRVIRIISVIGVIIVIRVRICCHRRGSHIRFRSSIVGRGRILRARWGSSGCCRSHGTGLLVTLLQHRGQHRVRNPSFLERDNFSRAQIVIMCGAVDVGDYGVLADLGARQLQDIGDGCRPMLGRSLVRRHGLHGVGSGSVRGRILCQLPGRTERHGQSKSRQKISEDSRLHNVTQHQMYAPGTALSSTEVPRTNWNVMDPLNRAVVCSHEN